MMDSVDVIASLIEDHREQREILSGMDALFATDQAYVRVTLPGRRLRFARCFHKHLATERAYLAKVASAQQIAAYENGIRELLVDYSAHVLRWSPERVMADQGRYVASAKSLRDRLLVRLEWEERELFPRLGHRAAA